MSRSDQFTKSTNFPELWEVPAKDLQVGDLGTGKAKVASVEPQTDGTTVVKWNNSPRYITYPAGNVQLIHRFALDQLVDSYLTAKATYENSTPGPRTDKAWKRMERIMEQAEKQGIESDLTNAVLETY